MIWIAREHRLDLRHRAVVMGILNVTPDSFSDGGRHPTPADAAAHAREMIDAGAQIIDVGGESTRPGAAPVDAREELRRVVPVIERIAARGGAIVSVDTSKAGVARAAIAAGASIVNDVSALRADPEMADTVRESGAGLVLMHMRGTPRTMQDDPRYADVVAEVRAFLHERLRHAAGCGIPAERVALDPGIGFGKTPGHNLELLARLDEIAAEGRPIVAGFSRKSFLAHVMGREEMEARAWPGVALSAYVRERGARVLRVHDARGCSRALRAIEALGAAEGRVP